MVRLHSGALDGDLFMSDGLIPYDWKKTAWKGIQIFVVGGLGALVSYMSGLPPEPVIVAAIAVFKMLQNLVKNYNWQELIYG